MPIFCPTCERGVAYVNEETSATTFLNVIFAPDGKTFCGFCEEPLPIDFSRKKK